MGSEDHSGLGGRDLADAPKVGEEDGGGNARVGLADTPKIDTGQEGDSRAIQGEERIEEFATGAEIDR